MLQHKPQVIADVRNHNADDHHDKQQQHQKVLFPLHNTSPSSIPRKEVLGRSPDLPSHTGC
jgi:hypothetical protein